MPQAQSHLRAVENCGLASGPIGIPGRIALGRPPKPGARYPSGKLKPTQEARIAPALIHRIRDHAGTMGIDRRLGSEVGRLLMLEQLTGLEAGAAWRMAEVYGRYERFHGITRTTRSPSYESGMAGGGTSGHDGTEHEAAKDAFLTLRNHLRPFSYFHVQELERLCVDDRYVGPAALADVKPILHRMAKQHFGTTRDARTEVAKRPVRPAVETKPRLSSATERRDRFAQVAHIELPPDLVSEVFEFYLARRELAQYRADMLAKKRESEQ